MPFSVEQLTYAGRIAIDWFLKNDPVDQINVERPLIAWLLENKVEYGGGLQYVVEQLRFSNDSNFQSYFGDQQVSYNRKRTIQQAKFTWGAFHDGFGLDEDELASNGIVLTEDSGALPTANEKVALTDLLKENMETLKLGFQENFDLMVHRDGTQSATDIAGLDLLVSTVPASSLVIGGLNQLTFTWWRNYADLTLALVTDATTALAFITKMETAWRETMRYGGFKPDKFLCGAVFQDNYRKACQLLPGQFASTAAPGGAKGGITRDAGTNGLYFHGVEVEWDPVFEILDTLDAPAQSWTKRGYMLNSRFIKLRPIKGHWMVSRRPPRVYDRYVHYWALTSKAALSTGKRNAQAVVAIP